MEIKNFVKYFKEGVLKYFKIFVKFFNISKWNISACISSLKMTLYILRIQMRANRQRHAVCDVVSWNALRESSSGCRPLRRIADREEGTFCCCQCSRRSIWAGNDNKVSAWQSPADCSHVTVDLLSLSCPVSIIPLPFFRCRFAVPVSRCGFRTPLPLPLPLPLHIFCCLRL